MNTAVEAKLRNPIHSVFEARVVRHAIGHCCGEESGPFCWLVPATGIAVFDACHQFAEHASQM